MSDYFCISNGVRQGRILSPKLFSVYVDDLPDKLIKSKVGCYIDNLCMNHVMYADDICLMAPSPASLQELIDICSCYLMSVFILYFITLFTSSIYGSYRPEINYIYLFI